MKRFNGVAHWVICRSGIIVGATLTVLVLSSSSAPRLGVAVLAAIPGVPSPAAAENNNTKVVPFRVSVPDADLADLRRRLKATRWPDKETAADQWQGVQLAKLQELVRYWGTDYDWRKAEAKLNALPQFTTNIDGVDIHFIHVRSRHPNAMPLIITHGWPGSVFEQIKLIGPLTDPTKYGGRAEDAFDVVIPSLPGFGFSGRPTQVGWGLERIGSAWAILMQRLGYTHYVAQGGDWGAGVVEAMGRQAPAGLLGIHTNFPAAITNEVGAVLGGGPVPATFTQKEGAAVADLGKYSSKRRPGLPDDDGCAAAGRRLRPDGLAGWPRRMDARAPRVRQVDVRSGPEPVADERRRPGQLHSVLAHEHRGIGRADLLGEP